jgi:Lysylphosphatidylglycerol synthase TM region
MKLAARIALIAGLGVMILLIVHEGAVGIMKLLTKAGWILLWLVPLHVLPLLLDAAGWRAIIVMRCKLSTLFLIAVVRQAVNGLLPVANIGGEIVGIRLLVRSGVDVKWAASSAIVEVLLTLVGQYLFVALGVAFLLQITARTQPAAIGYHGAGCGCRCGDRHSVQSLRAVGTGALLAIRRSARRMPRDLGRFAIPGGVHRLLPGIDPREFDPGRPAVPVHRARASRVAMDRNTARTEWLPSHVMRRLGS